MTKDEIIEMVVQIGGCDRPEYDSPALKIFETFATQVAEAEREACAKVCEAMNWYMDDGEECATAIRARGSHD
jgi:hypothetical protein